MKAGWFNLWFFGLLIFGMLAIANCVSNLYRIFPIHKWLTIRLNINKRKKEVERYILFITPKEREIIGYLPAHNQKHFNAIVTVITPQR